MGELIETEIPEAIRRLPESYKFDPIREMLKEFQDEFQLTTKPDEVEEWQTLIAEEYERIVMEEMAETARLKSEEMFYELAPILGAFWWGEGLHDDVDDPLGFRIFKGIALDVGATASSGSSVLADPGCTVNLEFRGITVKVPIIGDYKISEADYLVETLLPQECGSSSSGHHGPPGRVCNSNEKCCVGYLEDGRCFGKCVRRDRNCWAE
jgi:hypothetical protein